VVEYLDESTDYLDVDSLRAAPFHWRTDLEHNLRWKIEGAELRRSQSRAWRTDSSAPPHDDGSSAFTFKPLKLNSLLLRETPLGSYHVAAAALNPFLYVSRFLSLAWDKARRDRYLSFLLLRSGSTQPAATRWRSQSSLLETPRAPPFPFHPWRLALRPCFVCLTWATEHQTTTYLVRKGRQSWLLLHPTTGLLRNVLKGTCGIRSAGHTGLAAFTHQPHSTARAGQRWDRTASAGLEVPRLTVGPANKHLNLPTTANSVPSLSLPHVFWTSSNELSRRHSVRWIMPMFSKLKREVG